MNQEINWDIVLEASRRAAAQLKNKWRFLEFEELKNAAICFIFEEDEERISGIRYAYGDTNEGNIKKLTLSLLRSSYHWPIIMPYHDEILYDSERFLSHHEDENFTTFPDEGRAIEISSKKLIHQIWESGDANKRVMLFDQINNNLTEKQRTTMLMLLVDDFSITEVADLLNVTVNTVRKRARAAYDNLVKRNRLEA